MLLLETNKLKKYILENLPQEEIVAVFLDITEEDVRYCLANTSNKIKNPLRDDKHPSLGMRWVLDKATSLPKIRLHDFADHLYRGDCFDLISWTSPLNPTNPADFIKICKVIIDYSNRRIIRMMPAVKRDSVIVTKAQKTIEIQQRIWNNYDNKIWNRWGLDQEDLKMELGIPIEYAWINSKYPNYTYTTSDPCYAYYLGYDPMWKNNLYQLYFPLRSKYVKHKPKFITNNPYSLHDFAEFNKKDILVLVKSKKDKMVINKLLTILKNSKEYGNEAFLTLTGGLTYDLKTISSEVPSITKTQNELIRSNYKIVFVYTDFDRAGRQTAYFYKKEFGYYPLHITNGRFNTVNYGSKDISDIRCQLGIDRAMGIIKNALSYIDDVVSNYDDVLNLVN